LNRFRQTRKNSPDGLFFLGATNPNRFELINEIAEWLYENQDASIFKAPKLSLSEKENQRLQQLYAY